MGLLAAAFEDFDQPKLAEKQLPHACLRQSPYAGAVSGLRRTQSRNASRKDRGRLSRWQQPAPGANVLAAMGALAATAGEHAEAVAHYSASLALKPAVLIRVRLARSFLALGEADKRLGPPTGRSRPICGA